MAQRTFDYPDGIAPGHAEPRGGLHRHASLVSTVVLLAVMLLGLSGLLGGARTDPRRAEFAKATLTVTTPTTLRSGLFFEMHVAVTARRPIGKLVVALSPRLWRDMTINTVVPAAAEEQFNDGAFRFDYGPLAAGKSLIVKVDGQINPPLTLGNAGEIALYDGDRRLGGMPVRVTVLP
ncbi:hypothetical protein SAMN06297144_0310 [Sphingomonas guangdongensis]|uniref:Uncharacterized protein n=1 Tax=Sphingomonas guangdongensis TaxID=1141890 RepID=A0A285QFX4_9SPHN|nr:hypothetical protein [Sphingomonas guangdongensis]SOB78972.1 hypothetical protein SAMN06297144_0310 [Sphingomonas guangdongensis]